MRNARGDVNFQGFVLRPFHINHGLSEIVAELRRDLPAGRDPEMSGFPTQRMESARNSARADLHPPHVGNEAVPPAGEQWEGVSSAVDSVSSQEFIGCDGELIELDQLVDSLFERPQRCEGGQFLK